MRLDKYNIQSVWVACNYAGKPPTPPPLLLQSTAVCGEKRSRYDVFAHHNRPMFRCFMEIWSKSRSVVFLYTTRPMKVIWIDAVLAAIKYYISGVSQVRQLSVRLVIWNASNFNYIYIRFGTNHMDVKKINVHVWSRYHCRGRRGYTLKTVFNANRQIEIETFAEHKWLIQVLPACGDNVSLKV